MSVTASPAPDTLVPWLPTFATRFETVITPRSRTGEQVFVVDDDAAVCTALSVLIESAGYAARCYTSGEAFIDAVGATSRGCAVVDVSMPGLDGPGVLATLRAAGNPLPVIFVTAHDLPAKHRQLIANGGRAVFLKPVDPAQLLAEIQRSLGGDRVTAEP